MLSCGPADVDRGVVRAVIVHRVDAMPLCQYGCGMIERVIPGGKQALTKPPLPSQSASAFRRGSLYGEASGWTTSRLPPPRARPTASRRPPRPHIRRGQSGTCSPSDGTVVFGDSASPGSMLTDRCCAAGTASPAYVRLDAAILSKLPTHSGHGSPTTASRRSTSRATAPAKRPASCVRDNNPREGARDLADQPRE